MFPSRVPLRLSFGLEDGVELIFIAKTLVCKPIDEPMSVKFFFFFVVDQFLYALPHNIY